MAVVDLSKFLVGRTIPLDAAPAAVVSHPRQPKVFVLTPATGTVHEIDAAWLSVSRRARAGSEAVAMKLAPAGDALWILYRNPAALVELPLDTFQPRRRLRLADPPDDFDLSREGRAAVISTPSRTLAVAALDGPRLEYRVPAGPGPSNVCFQWDGKQVLVSSRSGRSLTIFDAPTGRSVVRLQLPLSPARFCFNSDGGQLFITGDGMDAVAVVYPYRTEVAESILAGRSPAGMAVTGPYLLVANPATDSVTVLDIETRKLVAVVQVGREPGEIVITPDKQYALVLNEKSGDMAVIRLFALTTRRPNFKSAPLFTMIPVGAKPVGAAVVALT